MPLSLEERKVIRKLINKMFNHDKINIKVTNKVEATVIEGKKAVINFFGKVVVIETFEYPPKIFEDRETLERKI